MIEKVLPQDDTCHCNRRIGNHTKYEMWACLQSAGRVYRTLVSSLKEKCKD